MVATTDCARTYILLCQIPLLYRNVSKVVPLSHSSYEDVGQMNMYGVNNSVNLIQIAIDYNELR